MLRLRPWPLLLVALVLTGGCREGPGVGGSRGDFEVEEAVLDFGRVLEGDTASRVVRLLGEGRAGAGVSASVRGGPFSLPASQVDVPGSGSVELEVRFHAGQGPAEGTLVLSAPGRTREVSLRGEGVRPLPCVPSGPCRESLFALEPGVCVERVAPDDTPCIPASRCQENGRCQAGACVGSPRSCDDGNPCTHDACAPDVGCVRSPVACPAPAHPCRVGVCHRERGCTEVDAPDSTACGRGDCISSWQCFSGSCQEVPTPEGTLCAPATPCQGEGRCGEGQCVRPEAGELSPSFAQALGGEPSSEPGGPVLLAHQGALFASVCGGDGGCRLVSYTDNGFLRFETPYPDGGARGLLAVSDAGVVLHEPQALEAYASSVTGALLWRLPLASLEAPAEGLLPTTGAGRLALGPEGEVVALVSWRPPESGEEGVDAGVDATLVLLAPDGGVLRAGPVEGFPADAPARLALETSGDTFLFAAGGPLVRVGPEDGGPGFLTWPLLAEVPDGGASLAVAGGRLLVGARAFVEADGGAPVTVDWEAGGRVLRPLDEPVLLGDDTGYVFAEEGRVLRALEARGGSVRWEVPVLPEETPGTLHEAALLRHGPWLPGGGVGTLTRESLDGGTRSLVQVFAGGERLLACPLPGTPRVAGAAYAGRFVYLALEREGTWWLEAFDLGDFAEAETRGWPHGAGTSGSRRAHP